MSETGGQLFKGYSVLEHLVVLEGPKISQMANITYESNITDGNQISQMSKISQMTVNITDEGATEFFRFYFCCRG